MAPVRRHSLTQRGRNGKFWWVHLSAALGVLVALLSTSSALAQTEADRATARSLAAEGYRALQASDFATAEDRFRRADALVHAPTLVVDHARALVGLGRLVEAHECYELVIREGVPPDAPRVWKRALEDADRELAALKPRLAWLVLYVDTPTAAQVSVDGVEVPRAALGVPRATDPGARSVSVSAPGYLSKETQVDLGEGEQRELRFTLDVDPDMVPLEEAAPEKAVAHPAKREQPADAGFLSLSQRTWAFASLGVGAAGAIGGGVTGGLFLRAGADLDKHCPNSKCPASYRDDVSRYRRLGWATGIGLGVGVAGLAAGTYLYLTQHGREDGQADMAGTLVPLITRDSVGVGGRF